MLNLKVARVDPEKHVLLIEGGVPGTTNAIILVRHTVKAPKKIGQAPTKKKKG